jgi:toxin ParE1/3/4
VARLSPAARKDIRDILTWSKENFGVSAAARYRALLEQALRDIEADPDRPGAQARPELMVDGLCTYHLFLSRRRVGGIAVKSPRHLVLYRYSSDRGLEIGRVLHEQRDLVRHIPKAYRRSELGKHT